MLPDAELLKYVGLALLGVFIGILNVLAGGGSFFTLPLLIFMGLPAPVANGTNRLSLITLNLTASSSFFYRDKLPLKTLAWITPTAMLGAYLGSEWVIGIPDHIFNKLLALLMIATLILMNVRIPIPERLKSLSRHETIKHILLAVAFFFLGLHGGSLQAGNGFLMIAALNLVGGFDLITTNALKVAVVLFYTFAAFGNFLRHDLVVWPIAIALAVGTTLGGWLGTHTAIKMGHERIRVFISICLVVLAVLLLFFR